MTTRKVTTNTGLAIRVLHVVQSLRGGGAEALVRQLTPRLRQRGIDAQVLCAYGDSQLTELESTSWAGVVHSLQRLGIPRMVYLDRMRRLMRNVSPNIVHTHTHVGDIWGRAAAVLARVPRIVHTEHGSDVESTALPEKTASAILDRWTDATVSFSQRTARQASIQGKISKLHIIPNGIPIGPPPSARDRKDARRELGFSAQALIIGIVANLYPHKNPGLALEAIGSLKSSIRDNVRLAFFGDGPLLSELKDRAKELAIDSVVRFYGFRSDIERLLPGIDLALTTSPREMMPISLLEAMHAGLPIIGAPHSGTLDLVVDGDTGIIVKSWDPVLFARAIEWVVEHPEWRERTGAMAYTRCKNFFNIETVADQYADLYRSLLR